MDVGRNILDIWAFQAGGGLRGVDAASWRKPARERDIAAAPCCITLDGMAGTSSKKNNRALLASLSGGDALEKTATGVLPFFLTYLGLGS